jgi:hypothetical protein
MIKEFIPYEQALALKELGFDEECLSYYFNKQLSFGTRTSYGEVIEVPLYQQAFRWFRDKYTIDSIVQPTYSTKYQYRVFKVEAKSKVQVYGDYMSKEFNTYEEAELACLIKLIEIVKKK